MKKASNVDFFENGLCGYCNTAKNELIDIIEFHTETESSWAKRDSELQSALGDLLKEHPDEQHEDIIEAHAWDIHLNQNKYPSIHRESLLITIYNFLEAQLNELCEIISESIENKVKLEDLSDKGIHRALQYLTKVGGFDLSKMGGELSYIKTVNKLRNQVVHNGGCLPVDPSHKLNKFVAKTSALSGSPGDHVSLNPNFIGEFIDVLTKFFEKLDHEVQSFIQSSDE